jgi:hypothetical protein
MLSDEIEDSGPIGLIKVGQVVHDDYSAWRSIKGEPFGSKSLKSVSTLQPRIEIL